MQLALGDLAWHSEETQGPTWSFTLATQSHVNPCVWDSPGGREVYFNNLALPGRLGQQKVPNGTDTLEVLLEWGPADYVGHRLVLAYHPAGLEAPLETDWITNGERVEIDVEPSTKPGYWGLWACVSREGDDTLSNPMAGPRVFTGTLAFNITALPP